MRLAPGDWIDVGNGPCAIMQIEAQQDRDGWSVSVQCAWTLHGEPFGDPASVEATRLKLGDVLEVEGVGPTFPPSFILRFIKHQFRKDEAGRQLRSVNLWGCDTLLAQIKDDERERQTRRVEQIDRHLKGEGEA